MGKLIAPVAGDSVHGDPARLKRIRAAKLPAITRPIPFDTPEADAMHEELRKIKGADFEVVQPLPGYQPPPE